MNYNTKKLAAERVAIAKVALEWIQAGALVPHYHSYIEPLETNWDDIVCQANVGKQLRDVKIGKCGVCAKGALFLAKAVRFDNVKISMFTDIEDDASYNDGPLSEHFDPKQLLLIECAYEGFYHESLETYANRYERLYPNRKERLIAILQNIIDNNGTFIYKGN